MDKAADASRDWEAVRAAADIQFAPLPPAAPPSTPEWLIKLGEWLQAVLEPVGKAFGVSWPVLEKLLMTAAGVVLLWIVWRMGSALIRLRRKRPSAQDDWLPERETALALLEDADALAAQGRFGEAAHLLLQRSVGQIAQAHPDWLHPASTAREIALFARLPEQARRAFADIATLVERSLFALRSLDAADWQAARAAYARFAQVDIEQGKSAA